MKYDCLICKDDGNCLDNPNHPNYQFDYEDGLTYLSCMNYIRLKKSKLLPILFLICINCSDGYTPLVFLSNNDEDEIESIQFTPKPNLPKDNNGLYHITLGGGWQTLHRLNGIVHRGADTSNGMNVLKVAWGSSLYWDWDGYSIPTINGASYSREDGSVSTMMAVTPLNRDDTMIVYTIWYDDWKSEEGFGEPFYIVIH